MPNLLLDFAKGLGSAFVPQSLSELKSDADNIKDTLMTGGRNAQEKYREIRNSSAFKKVTDSLFHRRDELGSDNVFDGNDDEFDAGFQFGASDKEEEPKAKVLDYDSMKDIAKSQVSSMYEIAGKQTEASAMTASEIISTMNTRSSEILSSLGNINSSLSNIGSKLDKLIELTTVAKNTRKQGNGPFDMNGNLTFGSVFDFAKGSLQNKFDSMKTMLSIPLSLFQMSKATGESNAQSVGMITGMLATMVLGDKKIFGGRSWDDIQSAIDTKIANAQNNALTKILNNSIFKKIFGDHTTRRANQDYGMYVENQYTRDKAVFDGMTRKTIIDIIPGYLRRITEAVTGQTLFVSPEGNLTTERVSGFQNMIKRTITDGFTSRQIEAKRVSSGTQVDSKLIYTAQRVLTSQYINYFLRKGANFVPQEYFEDGGDSAINQKTVDLLTQSGEGSREDWQAAVDFITSKMMADKSMRSSYVRKLSGEVQAQHKRLKHYAENATDTYDIGKITEEMVDRAITDYLSKTKGADMRTYGELKKAGIISEIPAGFKETDRASDEAIRTAEREKMKQSEILGSIGNTFKKSSDTTLDYVASIFEILNRGINVFSVNGKQKKKFGEMKVKHISSLDGGKSPSVSASVTTGVNVTPKPQSTAGGGTTTGEGGGDKQPQPGGTEGSRQTDYVGNVKNFLSNPLGNVSGIIGKEFSAIGDDVNNVTNRATATASIEINRSLVQNELNKGDVDQEDRDIANAVLQAMSAAAADGDTKEDMAALSSQISEIKNPKLKSRLSAIVEGTLKRSESKKPASSKLGKILLWGWGIVKTAFGGVLSKAKTFITGLGKTLLSPLINSLKSSGNMIVRGGQSIKEGLFGSDESYGIFGRMKNRLFGSSKLSSTKLSSTSSAVDLTERNIPEGYGSTTDDSSMQAQTQARRRSGISDSLSKLGDKFKKTEFGQGFMSAFEKKTEMKPQTLADQSTKSILDILKSKDGKSGAGETVLSKMLGALTNLKSVFENGVKNLGQTGGTNDGGMESIGAADIAKAKAGQAIRNVGATKGASPTMDSITTGSTVSMGEITAADIDNAKLSSIASGLSANGTTSAATTGGTAAGGKTKGLGFDIGKILGGMSSILLGIGKAVLSVVLSMAAVKKIMDLFMKVLKTSLQPLNKAFQKLYKAIKPVLATVQKVLKQIVEYVVQIVEAVIDFIQPLLEAIGPLLEQIMEILNPILEMITGLVEVLLVPLTAVLQTVVVPVLKAIGNTLEILLGIVQVGLGIIITGIGASLMATGTIVKWLTGSEGLANTGTQLFEMGTNMTKSGAQNVVNGMKKSVALAGETLTGLLGVEKEEEEEETPKVKKTPTPESLNGSPMDGMIGAGDASSELRDLYGGYGAQSRYGNYLNMSQRGCGPVALADAYSRRSGHNVDPRGLASAMSSSGAYNPSAGTSVQGYINASRSMGMNLTPGGVTVGSLRQATPTNPITVIGSGTDYTTRNGNNHYMNVIGSSGGTAFVSNPMTGRVERRSMSSLASSSVLGLYGSGNAEVPSFRFSNVYGAGDDNAPYKFSDEVTDALSNLKSLVGNIISMFTGGSESEQLAERYEAEKQKEQYNQAKIDTSALSEEEQANLDTEARKLFEANSPRYQGETDAEYEKRYQRSKDRYWTMAATQAVHNKVKSVADGTDEGATKLINYTLGDEENPGFLSGFAEAMSSAADEVEAGGFQSLMEDLSGGYWDDEYYDSGFYSDKGARLYTDEYDPTVFENDATGWTDTAVPNTVMGEWMDKMLSGTMMSSPFRWRGRPVDKDAEGTNDGRAHAGVDFTLGGDIPILSTTDGEVIGTAKTSYGDGYGTYVKIMDEGGDIHLYAHMREDPGPMVEEGDYVYGGDQLGIMGNTGESYGQHLHYEIRNGDTGEIMNPHSFFKWYDGYSNGAPYGPIDYEGELSDGDIWDLHKNKAGVEKFIQTAFDAGLTGPEIAAITSMGIWEDGGEKLWGDKSLLNVTHDVNGQQAVGLMNWVDTSVDYGDTVEEQLQYIQGTYFDENSDDFRALVRHTDYDAADLDAYKVATGRNGWELDFGDHYGPYMNEEDLIEGSEHWYRGALVPACIHTPEGPRKYIGTAVGVYNWLIDEGWIDPEADAISGLRRYNRTSWRDSVDKYTTSSADTATNYVNAAVKEDSTDGVPNKFTSTSKGTFGVAKNAAGTELFDYYVYSGVSMADSNALKGKSVLYERIGVQNGVSFKYAIIKFRDTTAGGNAKLYMIGQYKPSNSSGSIANEVAARVSEAASASAADQAKINAAKAAGLNWAVSKNSSGQTTYNGWTDPKYFFDSYYDSRGWANEFWKKHGYNNAATWSDATIASKLGALSGTYDSYKNKPFFKLIDDKALAFWNKLAGYPDTKSLMRTAGWGSYIDNNRNSYYYKRAGSTYDKYYKDLMNDYYSDPKYLSGVKMYGAGDSATIVPMNTTMSSTADYATDFLGSAVGYQSPMIVNQYANVATVGDMDTRVAAILSNTYNVRSVQIESMLGEMLKLMKEKNQRKRSRAGTATDKTRTSNNQFSGKEIPQQVERLSVG